MSTTAATLLDACNAAILALLAGAQSARVGNRSYSRADLSALRQLRSDLQAEANIETETASATGYSARTFAQNGGRG